MRRKGLAERERESERLDSANDKWQYSTSISLPIATSLLWILKDSAFTPLS